MEKILDSQVEKKAYIECLRVISMVAVVFTHIGATAHTDFPDTYNGSWGGFFFQSIVYISHFAVPVFLMITGALLLDPNKEISIIKIFKRYIGRYCCVLVIFGWGYAYIERLFISRRFVLTDIYGSFVDMLQGKTWAHMWYLYTLIGLMLILPFMRAFVKSCNDGEKNYLLAVIFLFASVFQTMKSLFDAEIGIVFPMNSIYICYMIIGYVLDNTNYRKSKWTIAIGLFCISVLIITAYYNIMYNKSLPFGSYYSPIIVVFSSLIFLSFKQNVYKVNKCIGFLSEVSFGVYVIHMVWINLAFKLLKIDPVKPNPLSGILVAIITLFLSVFFTWIMKRLPILKKVL